MESAGNMQWIQLFFNEKKHEILLKYYILTIINHK